MYDTPQKLYNFLKDNNTFFICLTPEVPDFTINQPFTLSFYLIGKKLDILITSENAKDILGALEYLVFKKNNNILCWNIKELYTCLKFYTGSLVNGPFPLDLKLIESFLGITKKCPENLTEAIDRARVVGKSVEIWKDLNNKIFSRLSKEVIPSIETLPLLDEELRDFVYSHYEIDGQSNGRSLCESSYVNSYNPHILGSDVKSRLKPVGDNLFLYCDYNHFEVTVLQWLSKDERMKAILDSGKDFYRMLYRFLFNESCKSDEDRNRCKKLFLPVIFGQSAYSVSQNMGLSIEESEQTIKKMKNLFPTAFSFVESKEMEATMGVISDYFGRTRKFEKPYKARNFVIQSPASIFCLEKLIGLYDLLKDDAQLAFHVHDGYGIISTKNNYKDIIAIAQSYLEDYSSLMPGLRVSASVKFGYKLNKLDNCIEGKYEQLLAS